MNESTLEKNPKPLNWKDDDFVLSSPYTPNTNSVSFLGKKKNKKNPKQDKIQPFSSPTENKFIFNDEKGVVEIVAKELNFKSHHIDDLIQQILELDVLYLEKNADDAFVFSQIDALFCYRFLLNPYDLSSNFGECSFSSPFEKIKINDQVFFF
jgi:hypothetical protein